MFPVNGKLSASSLKPQTVKPCQEFEPLKMQKLMNQYLLFLSQMGVIIFFSFELAYLITI